MLQVLAFYDIPGLSKWLDLLIIAAMGVFFRLWFVLTLKFRECMSKSSPELHFFGLLMNK